MPATTLAAFVGFLMVTCADVVQPQFDPAKYGWYNDYSAAKAEAKRTGKPIFLIFRCEP